MNDNIIKKAFITLISTFLLIGLIITMITNGERAFSITTFIKNYNIVNDNMNLYDKLVKTISMDNYSNLTQFEKEFFFSSKLMDVIQNLANIGQIPIIGWLLESMLVSIIATVSALVFIIEILLKAITLLTLIVYTFTFTLTGEIVTFA